MANEVVAGGVGELRALSTAAGGTALTTTAKYIPIPRNTHHIFITPRNFATAVVAKFSLNPYLTILKTTDRMGTVTDYSNYAQDGDAATDVTLSSLNTLANGDWVLVGAHLPFRGVYVDMDDAHLNVNASILTVTYRKSDLTWANATATDGTINPAGTSLGVDGLVYWAVPTDWMTARLTDIYTGAYLADGTGTFTGSPIDLKPGRNTVTCTGAGNCTITLPTGATGVARTGTMTVTSSPVLLVAGANTVTTSGVAGTLVVDISSPKVKYPAAMIPMFWTRWVFSAALDADTLIDGMLCANRSTAYGELIAGQTFEQRVFAGPGGCGCVEALTDAGTANLIVNGASARDGGF